MGFLTGQPPLPALPPSVPDSVTVYLAPDEESFRSLTGGAAPDWGAAVALPQLRVMVIPSYASSRTLGGDRARVLRHEWAHLALHDYLRGERIPRWFDEGYAEWAAGWDVSQSWLLRVLLATGRAPPLDSLTLEWPRDAASARAAYLLAATAVEYLAEESGERGLARMLERWKGGDSFEEALRATYGVSSAQLESHWRRYVKRRYGWAVVLSHSVVFWTALSLLLLLLARRRRGRDRERMARLRAAELPELPAWWVEGEGAGDRADPSGEERSGS